jgi:GT2 family glycosyltransferase
MMKLSILIPSLAARKEMLAGLMADLRGQALDMGASGDVEILTQVDGGEASVGEKRNRLLRAAKGDFVAFVDDDDQVSGDYVYEILSALRENPAADSIGMRGILSIAGKGPYEVVYSLHNRGGCDSGGSCHRPPGHLTPIRRSIAGWFSFPETSHGEDFEWASEILRAGALKEEAFVDKVLYHYRFNPAGSATMPDWQIAPPRGDLRELSIVVLSANAANLKRCLGALFENEPALPRKNVIVVDDGAGIECRDLFPDVTWVKGAKPFVFSRNANLGIERSGGDVLLLNDDARLATRFGFLSLAWAARAREEIGLCSALVSGFVGNPAQEENGRVPAGIRYADSTLAFVAIYIPKPTIERIGLLDERFTGYGFEDNDYSTRCFKEGLTLAVYDGCIVRHEKGDSTFRARPDIKRLFEENQALFRKKWGEDALL